MRMKIINVNYLSIKEINEYLYQFKKLYFVKNKKI